MKKRDKKLKNIDSDNDGLSDYDEVHKYKTDPNNPDTDGDGLNDGDEIKMGLNPLVKDYFIPYEGNNYRPKALRPKRLLFYGLSALIIKLIVVAVFVSAPLSALLTPDILYEQSKKIIALTNQVRQSINIPLLSENSKLAQAATYKVQDMILEQYFAHTSPSGLRVADWMKKVGYNYAFGGENLAIGFKDADSVVEAWKKSPTHYSNIIDSDFSEIGVSAISGQYSGYDTILIAQYFGTQKQIQNAIIPEEQSPEIPPKQENINTETIVEQEVLSEKQTIAVDEDKTKVIIAETPIRKEKIIQATAYLSENTNSANITFGEQTVELIQDTEDKNKWSGSAILEDEKQKIIIPATLEAKDEQGNMLISDVKLENVTPQKISLTNQYTFAKKYRPIDFNNIFTFSSIYYKIILIMTLIILLMNIFIKIKIQKLDVIVSSLGLILVMIFFLIY